MNKETELLEQLYELITKEEYTENDPEDPEEKMVQMLKDYSKENSLRVLAEFDNYKKRTNKEINEIKDRTKFDTLSKFIDILDDWEFFSDIVYNKSKISDIKTGFELIDKKIDQFLTDNNIKEVPTNIPFNEDLHEAITTMDEGKKSGEILKVVSKGYMIGEKIIKYPKVIVQI
jgi:molecular chaperone GrpE